VAMLGAGFWTWLRDRANERILAGGLMLLALVWPALWNGFPIVFFDTGGYLERPFEETLAMGRSALYGAFLLIGIDYQFWPNIILQAALVAWLMMLTLRVHGMGGRPWLATAIIAGLCVFTGLPWYTAQLMPDILVAMFVLGTALLARDADRLRRWEIALLVAVNAAAIASHMSILALALGIVAFILILRALPWPLPQARANIRLPSIAVGCGVLLALSSNLVIGGHFAFTPGGFNFVFSRLVQDGIVHRYLDDHCPDPTIRLCSHRADLPQTADDWLWAEESPIHSLGGFEEFEPEARRIVLESLTLYPVLHVKTALASTVKQFTAVATGDGLTPWNWGTQFAFMKFAPEALKGYVAGRQATSPFDFTWINYVHVPLQALTIVALPIIVARRPRARISALAALLFVALIGNAAICGVLSNPHDRYQSRLAWLAALVVAIEAVERARQKQTSMARAEPVAAQPPVPVATQPAAVEDGLAIKP
jgi:hypothetical protein